MLFEQRHSEAVMVGKVSLRSFEPVLGILETLENVDYWVSAVLSSDNNKINSHKTPMVSGYWLGGIK